MKAKKVRSKIAQMLWEVPAFRDDLQAVMVQIWKMEMLEEQKHVSAHEFFEAFQSGAHTKPETIRRAWQYIQEKHPALRGKLYDKRHRKSEEVKQAFAKQTYPIIL